VRQFLCRAIQPGPENATIKVADLLEYFVKTFKQEFTFTVPAEHPEAGTEITKSFEYFECETDEEIKEVMERKKLSLYKLVNDKLKSDARSNAYQTATLPYKTTELTKEEITEKMVRDYIRMGNSEEKARRRVAKMLAEEDDE